MKYHVFYRIKHDDNEHFYKSYEAEGETARSTFVLAAKDFEDKGLSPAGFFSLYSTLSTIEQSPEKTHGWIGTTEYTHV